MIAVAASGSQGVQTEDNAIDNDYTTLSGYFQVDDASLSNGWFRVQLKKQYQVFT